MSEVFDFTAGSTPLLISVPHDGRQIPAAIAARMSDAGRAMADTDWHVRRLYDFADDIGASVLAARYSRYVIDLNRPADGQALYPGQDETGLCPTSSFDREPLYEPGQAPTPQEIRERVKRYWQPYHDQLAAELARLRDQHGRALLWEAHSIRSEVPRFFEGRLPDFNFGSDGGRCCPPEVTDQLVELARSAGYTGVVNGRFRGGYITRHYAAPDQGIYSLQLELAQSTYMDEDSFAYEQARAVHTATVIRQQLIRYREMAGRKA